MSDKTTEASNGIWGYLVALSLVAIFAFALATSCALILMGWVLITKGFCTVLIVGLLVFAVGVHRLRHNSRLITDERRRLDVR